MITWQGLSNAFTLFYTLSVAIGGVMVKVLIWLYQCSSYLLIIFTFIWQLVMWMCSAIWLLIYAFIIASSAVGRILFTGITMIVKYGYHGLSYLPYGIYSITAYSWWIIKDCIGPAVIQCFNFFIAMIIYVMSMMYNLLAVLCVCVVDVGKVSAEFIQHTAGPFIASLFYHLFYGVSVMIDYCYSLVMTILHYLTAMMLRIIDTLPGVLQPLASDVISYGSDIIATVISGIFCMLRWMLISVMDVMGLLVTSPAFWVIVISAIILSYLCYYYANHWHVDRRTAAPVERRYAGEERSNGSQTIIEPSQFIFSEGKDEINSEDGVRRRRERFEEEMLCVVCQLEKKTILLQPCNHLCLCPKCVDPVLDNRICPMCRKHVMKWTKVYL